jgi:clan AA aspartic protease
MILGQVTPDREAIIDLALRGPQGQELALEAVLDTGFIDYLTLPPALVSSLQLPYRDVTQFTLADGSVVSFRVFSVTILWDSQPRIVPTLEADGGPLVGMALLYGSRVTLDIVDGGQVTLEALP